MIFFPWYFLSLVLLRREKIEQIREYEVSGQGQPTTRWEISFPIAL